MPTEGSDRKRAGKLPHAREEELRLSFEHAPIGMATLDLVEGRFVRANRALCRLLGYRENELLGMTFLEVTHPEDREESAANAARLKQGLVDSYTLKKRYICKDGRVVEGVIHSAVIHDVDGRPLFQFGQFEDRTRWIQAEEEAHQLRERLAQVDRLNTLAEMAAGIAHEINQPLTSIATYAQAAKRLLAARKLESPDLPEAVEQIERQALRAGAIIQRVRTFAARQDSTRVHCDINELVRETIDLIRLDAKQGSMALRLELTPQLRRVEADPVQIQQVLVNLIRNAIEASTGHPGATEVVVRTRKAPSGDIEVGVEDHGPGVPIDSGQQVFDPFYTTKATGMGLGLSTSRSIVESHGGQLDYETLVQGGSVFHFTLLATVAP